MGRPTVASARQDWRPMAEPDDAEQDRSEISVESRHDETARLYAWVGTPDDLVRLYDVVGQELLKVPRGQSERDPNTFSVTTRRNGEHGGNDVRAVLDKAGKLADVRGFAMGSGRYGRPTVWINRGEWPTPAKLTVAGSDPAWVAGALAICKRHLDDQRPGWWWLTPLASLLVLWWIIFSVVDVILMLILRGKGSTATRAVVGGALAWLASVGVVAVLQAILPRVDLSIDGRSRGTRHLAWIGSGVMASVAFVALAATLGQVNPIRESRTGRRPPK